jgi:glutamate formiminotransferase
MVAAAPTWLVECVPNFSEGRDPAVMDSIEAAVRDVRGVAVLDRHADAVHNRMVLTFAGPIGAVAEAAFRCTRRASQLIDLRTHRGVHPRIGATDVLPFVPLGSTPMAVCVDLARRVGRRIAAELGLPVYLYAEAATRPERRRLALIRRGGYEGLAAGVADDPARQPDFGPARLGPAGATAVGARGFLVAFNVTLATGRLDLAEAVARAVRESSGGLPAVQARAFPTADPGVVQVSMNLLDTAVTPLQVAFERVRAEAESRGAEVLAGEVVGLVPTAAVADAAGSSLRTPNLTAASVLEARLLEAVLAEQRRPGR